MASYPITNAPVNFDMQTFRSISDNYDSLAKSCRYAVVFRPQGSKIFQQGYLNLVSDLTYLCEIAEFPGRGMNLLSQVRYYGPNMSFPTQTVYDTINFTFLCRNSMLERQFFDDWMQYINPIQTFDFNYRDDYISEVDIIQFNDRVAEYNEGPRPEYAITLHEAYPTLVNPQGVSWADQDFQRLTVNFTFTKWSRRGLDNLTRGTADQNGYNFNLVAGSSSVERENRPFDPSTKNQY